MRRTDRRLIWALAAALVLLLAVGLAACGGSDDQESSSKKRDPRAEQAFLQAMIPHHQSAVEMAEMAEMQGQHAEIKQLASDIVTAQDREISQMKRIYKRLFGKTIRPDDNAHHQLGLSTEQAGMEHMDMGALEESRPFDRAFIDQMIPHHQGAIRMARAVRGKTEDRELTGLAGGIISAQGTEITTMNGWRKRWYGAASPAGGTPRTGAPSGSKEEHQGHDM